VLARLAAPAGQPLTPPAVSSSRREAPPDTTPNSREVESLRCDLHESQAAMEELKAVVEEMRVERGGRGGGRDDFRCIFAPRCQSRQDPTHK